MRVLDILTLFMARGAMVCEMSSFFHDVRIIQPNMVISHVTMFNLLDSFFYISGYLLETMCGNLVTFTFFLSHFWL